MGRRTVWRHNKASCPFALPSPSHLSMLLDLFESLPDELVSEILSYLWISHLNSGSYKYRWPISLCNKRLRRIALPRLYHSICIADIKSLNRILQNVIEHPAYARLVIILEVDWYCNDVFETWSRDIKCAEEAGIYTSSPEITSNLETRDPKVNIMHLLHLLRDLEVIDIKAGPRHDRDILPYLNNFLNKCHLSTKLRRFEWRRCDFGVTALIPALLVPSMKQFRCTQVITDAFFDFHWFPDLPEGTSLSTWYGKSNVEELSLFWPEVSKKHVAEILLLPQNLKILIYQGELSPSPGDVQTHSLLKRAFDRISASLEFLYLSWQHFDRNSIISFQNFKRLKFLILDCSLIFYPPNLATRSYHISESLPPSLEVLFMYKYLDNWAKEHIFAEWKRLLIEKSAMCLPNLWLVGHQENTTLLLPLIDLASSRNVQIAWRVVDFIKVKESYLSKIRQNNFIV
jgi:hypothetical protein